MWGPEAACAVSAGHGGAASRGRSAGGTDGAGRSSLAAAPVHLPARLWGKDSGAPTASAGHTGQLWPRVGLKAAGHVCAGGSGSWADPGRRGRLRCVPTFWGRRAPLSWRGGPPGPGGELEGAVGRWGRSTPGSCPHGLASPGHSVKPTVQEDNRLVTRGKGRLPGKVPNSRWGWRRPRGTLPGMEGPSPKAAPCGLPERGSHCPPRPTEAAASPSAGTTPASGHQVPAGPGHPACAQNRPGAGGGVRGAPGPTQVPSACCPSCWAHRPPPRGRTSTLPHSPEPPRPTPSLRQALWGHLHTEGSQAPQRPPSSCVYRSPGPRARVSALS